MKAHGLLVGLLLTAGWSGALAQTKVDLRTQSKSIDFTGASLTKPARSAATLPGACSAGELFYLSSGPLYSCSSTNNWVRMGTVTGNTNSGDCARFDANGNVVRRRRGLRRRAEFPAEIRQRYIGHAHAQSEFHQHRVRLFRQQRPDRCGFCQNPSP